MLVYLKSYVKDRALSMIENMPISDDGFDQAWELLKEEFLDILLLTNDTFFVCCYNAQTLFFS